ncbi:MAG: hypothetical protein NC311_01425 [Muribaculaceae bacterium]|nr:hypothetical protein [Muribaculaceae bacterium]
MSRQIQIRRGTAAKHETFTGAIGEITMDTTNKTLRVHDGTTPGGVKLARAADVSTSPTIPETADYVVATQIPTAENNYTWYRKYKSGRVDIGGEYAGNEKTVQLPIILQNTNYTVQITKNSSPSYWATTHLVVASRNVASFTVSKYGDSASMKIGWLILNAHAA